MFAPLLALALALAAPFAEARRIDELRIEGLGLTQEFTVRRELTFVPGEVVTPASWDLFQTRLWNLGIFSRVELTLVEEQGRAVAVAKLEDSFPVAPIVYFQFGGAQFYLWLGAMHANLFGRALQTFVYYQRFGALNGFHVDLTDPRLLNTRASGKVEVEWLPRPRPQFLQLHGAVRFTLKGNLPGVTDDQVRLGLGVEATIDQFLPRGAGAEPLPRDSHALRAGPSLHLGRLDTDRLRFSRGFVQLRLWAGATDDPSALLWPQAELEAQWFVKLGNLFNFGSRVKAGIMDRARPQDRFYLGGLDAVRGYQDSEFRTLSHLTANVELRFVAFDSTWLAIMPVAFVDGSVMLLDTGEPVAIASGGVGLRLLIPRIPLYGLRAEIALPFVRGATTSAWAPGFNFGVWHFF